MKVKKNKKEPALVQDLLSVKAVERGYLLTKNNRLVAIMKIGTINKELLSEKENELLEEEYEALLQSFYFEYQELIVSEPLDNSAMIERERMKLNRTKDFHRRRLINSYIDFLIEKGKSSRNMRRFRYFIYAEKLESASKEGLEEAIQLVDDRRDEIISGFKDLKLPAQPLTGLEAVRLLQVFYNYEAAQNNPIESLKGADIQLRRGNNGNLESEAEREAAAGKE